ncbi:MAG: type III-A CRISPR-associated protein Cas10/Csm1 [Candidatus Brocadia sp.]|nr:type III-A CRISPR-associated protein Cas10/Csm1 [Candidatus Brocadia sp.]
MDEKKKREYQTVVLAGLLHDIGKFYQRGLDKEERKARDHASLGLKCYQKYFAKKIRILFGEEEKEKIAFAINTHHDHAEFITLADALSAGMERISLDAEETGDPSKERLWSVFGKISLYNNGMEINEYSHHLKPLSLKKDDLFPCKLPEQNLEDEYKKLWEDFALEVKNILAFNTHSYLNTLYSLLQKYTWCIPSEAYKSESDISLFDHLKTTSAIAGCLFVKKLSGEKDGNEFLLLSGDISGIQKFIYKITSTQGIGGISKRLRGRSFYLVLLQEVMATYILNKLFLATPHLLFCGGGRFEMLIPNTDKIQHDIGKILTQINTWLLKEYNGELGLVLVSVSADRNDLKDYSNLLKTLDDKLSLVKKRKSKEFLGENWFWLEDRKPEEEIRVCRSCNTTLVKKGENDEVCILCKKHHEIGSKLPKTCYLAFLSRPNNSMKGVDIEFGEFGNVYLLSANEYTDKYNELPDVLTIQMMNETIGNFRFIGNAAPIAKEDFEQETEEEEDGKKQALKDRVLTFETIADMSIGDKRIGILKMDVDYLGLIFAIGLPEGQKSISRIAALSRGMDWFFGGYLNNICKKVFEEWKKDAHKAGWGEKADKIENIFYIVYSGGDDLMIVGPWSEMPVLAKKIRDEFKVYTCNNVDINISAGIFFCKPKYPISLAVEAAGDALESSKDKGRRRITIFGETVEWMDGESIGFDNLLDCGEMFFEAITAVEKEDRLPRGFIHGLLRKHKQYESGDDLNYIPALIYQMERNIKKDAKITSGEIKLKEYLKEKLLTVGNGYFRKIRIPASYALLKSRKGD